MPLPPGPAAHRRARRRRGSEPPRRAPSERANAAFSGVLTVVMTSAPRRLGDLDGHAAAARRASLDQHLGFLADSAQCSTACTAVTRTSGIVASSSARGRTRRGSPSAPGPPCTVHSRPTIGPGGKWLEASFSGTTFHSSGSAGKPGATMTRSPAAKPATSAPSCSIRPTMSEPTTWGSAMSRLTAPVLPRAYRRRLRSRSPPRL